MQLADFDQNFDAARKAWLNTLPGFRDVGSTVHFLDTFGHCDHCAQTWMFDVALNGVEYSVMVRVSPADRVRSEGGTK